MRKVTVAWVVVVALGAAGLGAAALPAHAMPLVYPVTSTFDFGPGSLRQAVDDADLNPGPDIIDVQLPPNYAINLTNAIVSNDTLTVLGNGVTITIEGNPGPLWTQEAPAGGGTPSLIVQDLQVIGTRADTSGFSGVGNLSVSQTSFTNMQGAVASMAGDVTVSQVVILGDGEHHPSSGVVGGTVTVQNSIIANTKNDGSSQVGGAVSSNGSATITSSLFLGNHDNWEQNNADNLGGGAVYAQGQVQISGSAFDGNTALADGGAVLSVNGPVTAVDSVFTSNSAGEDGAAIALDIGSVDVTRSSFIGNNGNVTGFGRAGGAVMSTTDSASVTISNSTIVDNVGHYGSEPGQGGAIGVGGPLRLSFVTFDGNTNTNPQGGPSDAGAVGTIEVVGTVFGGAATSHCHGTVTSLGGNVEQGSDTCGLVLASDLANAGDPGLGAVSYNGGPTPTALPQSGSLLIDRLPAGSVSCTGVDQRGVPRPQGSGCDTGAVETGGVPPPAAIAGAHLSRTVPAAGTAARSASFTAPDEPSPTTSTRRLPGSTGPPPPVGPVIATPRFTG